MYKIIHFIKKSLSRYKWLVIVFSVTAFTAIGFTAGWILFASDSPLENSKLIKECNIELQVLVALKKIDEIFEENLSLDKDINCLLSFKLLPDTITLIKFRDETQFVMYTLYDNKRYELLNEWNSHKKRNLIIHRRVFSPDVKYNLLVDIVNKDSRVIPTEKVGLYIKHILANAFTVTET